jgi:hypothetical protein
VKTFGWFYSKLICSWVSTKQLLLLISTFFFCILLQYMFLGLNLAWNVIIPFPFLVIFQYIFASWSTWFSIVLNYTNHSLCFFYDSSLLFGLIMIKETWVCSNCSNNLAPDFRPVSFESCLSQTQKKTDRKWGQDMNKLK